MPSMAGDRAFSQAAPISERDQNNRVPHQSQSTWSSIGGFSFSSFSDTSLRDVADDLRRAFANTGLHWLGDQRSQAPPGHAEQSVFEASRSAFVPTWWSSFACCTQERCGCPEDGGEFLGDVVVHSTSGASDEHHVGGEPFAPQPVVKRKSPAKVPSAPANIGSLGGSSSSSKPISDSRHGGPGVFSIREYSNSFPDFPLQPNLRPGVEPTLPPDEYRHWQARFRSVSSAVAAANHEGKIQMREPEHESNTAVDNDLPRGDGELEPEPEAAWSGDELCKQESDVAHEATSVLQAVNSTESTMIASARQKQLEIGAPVALLQAKLLAETRLQPCAGEDAASEIVAVEEKDVLASPRDVETSDNLNIANIEYHFTPASASALMQAAQQEFAKQSRDASQGVEEDIALANASAQEVEQLPEKDDGDGAADIEAEPDARPITMEAQLEEKVCEQAESAIVHRSALHCEEASGEDATLAIDSVPKSTAERNVADTAPSSEEIVADANVESCPRAEECLDVVAPGAAGDAAELLEHAARRAAADLLEHARAEGLHEAGVSAKDEPLAAQLGWPDAQERVVAALANVPSAPETVVEAPIVNAEGRLERRGLRRWDFLWHDMYVTLHGEHVSVYDEDHEGDRSLHAVALLSEEFVVERTAALQWRVRPREGSSIRDELPFEWRARDKRSAELWMEGLRAVCINKASQSLSDGRHGASGVGSKPGESTGRARRYK